jgi:spermidine/putrescine transport system substrate-binding protein
VSVLLAALLALILGAALAGCGGNEETTTTAASTGSTTAGSTDTTQATEDLSRFKGEKLVVTTWSGPYAEKWEKVFVPSFEEKTGADVEVIPSWTEIPSKIKAAPADDPPFDVTIGDGSVYFPSRDDKLFLPLRPENIPNLADVFPALMEQTPAKEGFGAPFDGAPAAILYTPDVQMTKWADFWRPELKGKISWDKNFYYSIYPAIFALGLEPRKALTDPALLDQVYAKTKEIVPSMLKWYESGGEFFGLFERGELKAGYYYAPTNQGKIEGGLNAKSVIPSDGRIGYIDYYFVVRGTKHRDLAEAFINHLLDPEMQSQWLSV